MDAVIMNMFEINYSQLIQYEILEKLVTYISSGSKCLKLANTGHSGLVYGLFVHFGSRF